MRIAFLGDSLTEGWPGAAFFPLLERRFPQHELLNLGRAGDCVADLLRRLPSHDPGPVDLVVLWIGANDAVSAAMGGCGGDVGWEARLTRAVDDYGELLAWSAQRAPATVCVRPVVLEAEGSVWEASADRLGDAMQARAVAQPGTRVVDLRETFAAAADAGRGPFTVDGVHFTEAGAEVVAEALAVAIEAAGAHAGAALHTESEGQAGAGAAGTATQPTGDTDAAPGDSGREEAER